MSAGSGAAAGAAAAAAAEQEAAAAQQEAARKQEVARRAAARALAAKQAEVARLRHATQQQQRRLAADQVLPCSYFASVCPGLLVALVERNSSTVPEAGLDCSCLGSVSMPVWPRTSAYSHRTVCPATACSICPNHASAMSALAVERPIGRAS